MIACQNTDTFIYIADFDVKQCLRVCLVQQKISQYKLDICFHAITRGCQSFNTYQRWYNSAINQFAYYIHVIASNLLPLAAHDSWQAKYNSKTKHFTKNEYLSTLFPKLSL